MSDPTATVHGMEIDSLPYDYGEGKTRWEEERDSVQALAIVLIYCGVCLTVIPIVVVAAWWLL